MWGGPVDESGSSADLYQTRQGCGEGFRIAYPRMAHLMANRHSTRHPSARQAWSSQLGSHEWFRKRPSLPRARQSRNPEGPSRNRYRCLSPCVGEGMSPGVIAVHGVAVVWRGYSKLRRPCWAQRGEAAALLGTCAADRSISCKAWSGVMGSPSTLMTNAPAGVGEVQKRPKPLGPPRPTRTATGAFASTRWLRHRSSPVCQHGAAGPPRKHSTRRRALEHVAGSHDALPALEHAQIGTQSSCKQGMPLGVSIWRQGGLCG